MLRVFKHIKKVKKKKENYFSQFDRKLGGGWNKCILYSSSVPHHGPFTRPHVDNNNDNNKHFVIRFWRLANVYNIYLCKMMSLK